MESDPLELEEQEVMVGILQILMWVLGIELRSSERAVNALNK